MKLIPAELEQLKPKPQTKDDRKTKKLRILKAGNGKLTAEQLKRNLEKEGIHLAITSIREILRKEGIPYQKLNTRGELK